MTLTFTNIKKKGRKIQALDGKGHYIVKLCFIILDILIYLGLKTYNTIIWNVFSLQKLRYYYDYQCITSYALAYFLLKKIIMMQENISPFCNSRLETTNQFFFFVWYLGVSGIKQLAREAFHGAYLIPWVICFNNGKD